LLHLDQPAPMTGAATYPIPQIPYLAEKCGASMWVILSPVDEDL